MIDTPYVVGLYSPLPFPYIYNNGSDLSKCNRLLSSSPSNWSYSAQSFSISKSMKSCPLICKGRITLILPLKISI